MSSWALKVLLEQKPTLSRGKSQNLEFLQRVVYDAQYNNIKSSYQTYKEAGKCDPQSEENLVKTSHLCNDPDVGISNKNFKAATANMSRDVNKKMIVRSEQRGNATRETENVMKNQIEFLELKRTMREMNKCLGGL